jgi:hypothetical protein
MSYHNGSSRGGPRGEGGAFFPSTPSGSNEGVSVGTGTPSLSKTKSVSYSATTSNQIFSISGDPSSSTKETMPSAIQLRNNGNVPVILMVGYETYESDILDGVTEYLHIMLMPGQMFSPPIRAIIRTGASTVIMDGTVVDNLAPSSVNSGLLWKDSDANLAAHVRPASTDPITITVGSNETNYFRVGDLIQIGRGTSQTDLTEATYYREILRVQSITDGEDMVCERALYGTDAGDYDSTNWSAGHAIGQPVYLPFFNAYHDVDKYSVAQTDSDGRFRCYNVLGQGRSATASQGIMPGSVAIKFYSNGYQGLGLSGIRSSSESSLVASGSYWFKIAIDGGTAESINFTVDASNTSWGGTNGVVSRVNTALVDKYNNSASNTFQKGSSCAIVGGDIVFTSGSSLSTSAIALTAGVDGASATYNLFAQQNGHWPALANIRDAVPAKLPDDVVYSAITYKQTPNLAAFGYDNGYGRISGACSGTIDYETGELNIVSAPHNAEFVVSCLHSSAFSGALNESTADRINSLVDIYANTTNQKSDGSIKIEAF